MSSASRPPAERELTVRAVLTGALLGGVLSLCNIYSGLRIGWGFNMSITAALLGWGMWSTITAATKGPRFGKLENNLNQTAASAGASISSAGLVSAIPAWTMLTGDTLPWAYLAPWLFVVGMVGVTVGIGLRRQMIEVDRLPFANGIASAETLDKIHPEAGGDASEARRKLSALVASLGSAAAIKLATHLAGISQLKIPGTFAITAARRASLHNLTISFDASPLMIAVGALGSLRTGVTVLLGGLFSWGVLAPWVIDNGWAEMGPDDASATWFGPVVRWLLWPGVAMMVTSSLTSVAFSWRSIVRAFTGGSAKPTDEGIADAAPGAVGPDVSRRALITLAVAVTVASTLGQYLLFDIPIPMGVFATLLTFGLATVAGRVSGETTITPVGAMGKVTQLIFGILRPGDATANLMTANVTGGAASQTADLLHDLKTGALVGASPRAQAIAQSAGVLGGALIGGAAYLVMIPDPSRMLLTDEWPAPAVATWRAVAELFARGIEAMPTGAATAMLIAGALGIVLAILEKTLPEKARALVPSPASLGLSFTIQAWTCINLFLGSLVGWALRRWAPDWSKQYVTPLASGVIAGESLMGVGIAIWAIAAG
jgi:putative OPT family oligopeptide transporter